MYPDDTGHGEFPQLKRYSRLEPERKEIRLIRLGTNIVPEVFRLDLAPPYHAISYHWGPVEPTSRICVQGEQVEVRKNIGDLLQDLLELHGTREYFWIDVLCINQGDLGERNHQVSLMSEIFSTAVDVVSWIGTSTGLTRYAYQLFAQKIACPVGAPQRLRSSRKLHYHFSTAGTWPSTDQLESNHELYTRFAEALVWPALADILRRSYWKRLWVWQEMIVAKVNILMCGKSVARLEDFLQISHRWIVKSQYYLDTDILARSLGPAVADNQDIINTWAPLHDLLEYRDQFRNSGIKLMELVDSYAGKQCLDVRDKAYAIRSLSRELSSLKVDYSKSSLEVFVDLVQCGLLMSDRGRGFQSLPHLIRQMGLHHETLQEQLNNLPPAPIPILGHVRGILSQARLLVVDQVYQDSEDDDDDAPTLVKLTAATQASKPDYQEARNKKSAKEFFELARAADLLLQVPTTDPILLLLRALPDSVPQELYQVIAVLQNWGRSMGSSGRQLSANAAASVELVISNVERGWQENDKIVHVDSGSLPLLALWMESADKWWTISP